MIPLLKDTIRNLSSSFNEDLMKTYFLSEVCQSFSHYFNAFLILAI